MDISIIGASNACGRQIVIQTIRDLNGGLSSRDRNAVKESE